MCSVHLVSSLLYVGILFFSSALCANSVTDQKMSACVLYVCL